MKQKQKKNSYLNFKEDSLKAKKQKKNERDFSIFLLFFTASKCVDDERNTFQLSRRDQDK